MISAVIIHNEFYGYEALNQINNLKLSRNLKEYLFLLKSSELKTEHVGYSMYPFYLNVINKRISKGKKLESIQPFFFDRKGPITLLRKNQWQATREQIIQNYNSYQMQKKPTIEYIIQTRH